MLKSLNSRTNLINIFILLLINLCVFWNYWTGYSTPPWDFLGGGQVEQYRFYKDGGFFSPPSWFPYAWFGIPEYQMLQDGGWFLPVAIVAELFTWNPPNAARVQAFLVLFGAIGTYLLSDIYLKNKKLALLSGVLYHFIPAFYSNAQHYGVVRSAALLPWVLFFLNHKIILRYKVSIFIGSLIIFQTIVGSYPGNLISIFYTSIIFVIYNFWELKINKLKYLRAIIFVTISGIFMGALRYLPVAISLNSFPENIGNQAGINFNNLVYLVFPFFGDNLPWADPTLRSIYIGSLSLIALFFIRFKDSRIYLWLILTIISIVFMIDNRINDFVRSIIPFANISRFGITDWRNTFNLGIIMISVLTLSYLIEKNKSQIKYRVVFVIAFTFYIAYLGLIYEFTTIHVVFYLFMIVTALILVLLIHKKSVLNLAILISFIFGYLFVLDNSFTWSTTVKEQYFNIYRTDFSNVKENIKYPLISRPKRHFFKEPPLTAEEYKTDQRYNRFWLTGGFGALGYHNIKDIPTYRSLFPRLESTNDPLIKFLSFESKQIVLSNGQNINSELLNCVNYFSCNKNEMVDLIQISFDKESEKFQIKSEIEFELIQNEIYSPIWSGEICEKDVCKEIESYASLESLRSWKLPKGEYILETKATTPLNTSRWILFFLGFGFIFFEYLSKLFDSRRSRIKN